MHGIRILVGGGGGSSLLLLILLLLTILIIAHHLLLGSIHNIIQIVIQTTSNGIVDIPIPAAAIRVPTRDSDDSANTAPIRRTALDIPKASMAKVIAALGHGPARTRNALRGGIGGGGSAEEIVWVGVIGLTADGGVGCGGWIGRRLGRRIGCWIGRALEHLLYRLHLLSLLLLLTSLLPALLATRTAARPIANIPIKL